MSLAISNYKMRERDGNNGAANGGFANGNHAFDVQVEGFAGDDDIEMDIHIGVGDFPVDAQPNVQNVGAVPEPNHADPRRAFQSHTNYYILVVFNHTLLEYLDEALVAEAAVDACTSKAKTNPNDERYFRSLDGGYGREGWRFVRSKTPKVVEWEKWGPENTRVWAERLGRTWLRCVLVHFLFAFKINEKSPQSK